MKTYYITIERMYFDIEVRAADATQAKQIAKDIIQRDSTPDDETVTVDHVEEESEE